MMQRGSVLIETLKAGDPIFTRDNGFQPLRRIGTQTVPAISKHTPIFVLQDALGDNSALLVSPNHRMFISDPITEMHFGERELLASTKHLVDMNGIGSLCRYSS
jgi:hypothetical protein